MSPEEDPKARGLKIAQDARERGEGLRGLQRAVRPWCSATGEGRRVGASCVCRFWRWRGEGDKSLFVFDEPRDVQGTALLIHSHREKDDEQWLYLPALRAGQANQLVEPVRLLHGQ